MKKLTVSLVLVSCILLLSMTIRTPNVNDELLCISREYQSYNLYNSLHYWTLAYCEPMTLAYDQEDTLHMSKADPKKSPHGDRLYKLYVKDLEAYRTSWEKQPEGQVLIKEVWNVRPVMDSDSALNNKVVNKRSMKDHWFYTPTTRKALYIMYKTAPSEENDEGWWYGIVDIESGVENAKVIESMKINRCIKCHQQNKTDRIFGMPD